jgi:hypothetical protein
VARSLQDQHYRASALNLVVSAITVWNTIYIEKAVEHLRHQRWEITDKHLEHLTPLGWEYISLTGDYILNPNLSTSLTNLTDLRTEITGNCFKFVPNTFGVISDWELIGTSGHISIMLTIITSGRLGRYLHTRHPSQPELRLETACLKGRGFRPNLQTIKPSPSTPRKLVQGNYV